jgi:hypothetical protein
VVITLSDIRVETIENDGEKTQTTYQLINGEEVIIEEITESSEGIITHNYTYDEFGRVNSFISSEKYNNGEFLNLENNYEYYDDGKYSKEYLKIESNMPYEDNCEVITEYKYDKDNISYQHEIYYQEGELYYDQEDIMEYNDKNQLIKKINSTKNKSGELKKETDFEYYANGNTKKKIVKEEAGTNKKTSGVIEYDENGKENYNSNTTSYGDGRKDITTVRSTKEIDENGNEVEVLTTNRETIGQDGSKTIENFKTYEGIDKKYSDKKPIKVIRPDGTIEIYNRDEDGNFTDVIITKPDGTISKIKYVYNENDLVVERKMMSTNDLIKPFYKKNNNYKHIEYDEESYKIILSRLNSVSSSSGVINGSLSSIVSIVNTFPDQYSVGAIDDIKNSFNSDFNLINSLIDMTNYSLLTYQSCDDNLRNEAYELIDNIFDDNIVAKSFKNSIKSFIENNDGILKYKDSVNILDITNNSIPVYKHIDDDGNIWYFNKNKNLISAVGDNLKITYGNEVFSLSFTDDNTLILKDSNNNNISIFGDYNLPSKQYGGNQEDFYNNQKELLKDELINNVFDYYSFNSTYEERSNYLERVREMGCGKVAMTNIVFNLMEGKEEEFKKTFGYPMYNIKMNDDGSVGGVDYNYEPLVLELSLASKTVDETRSQNVSYKIDGLSVGGPLSRVMEVGSDLTTAKRMVDYLNSKYGIFNKEKSECGIYYSDEAYNLYDFDGIIHLKNGGGHAMTITGYTPDGRIIVSSWGEKFICEPGDRPETFEIYN